MNVPEQSDFLPDRGTLLSGQQRLFSGDSRSSFLPMLRKDFIIDTYQIDEARVMGADAILLIAAILDAPTMRHFYEYATELGLHCLFEAHNEAEMEQVLACGAKICGINNRNLKNFVVDLKTTERLAAMVPNDCILVSESGMQTLKIWQLSGNMERCGIDWRNLDAERKCCRCHAQLRENL